MTQDFSSNELTIALVSPASISPKDKVDQAQTYLEQTYSFNVQYTAECYLAFPAEQRAEFFMKHLLNDTVDVLWACRGGEGSADLIPYFERYRSVIKTLNPKTIIGFSDITALLFYFSQEYNWPVIHASGANMIGNNEVSKESEQAIIDILLKRRQSTSIDDLQLISDGNDFSSIEAPIVAGNLSLLNISINDTWHIQLKDKIIVIEDVNEKPYEVWRTLKYLLRVGVFNEVKAVVFGDFLAAKQKLDSHAIAAWLKIFKQFSEHVDSPVFITQSIGHGYYNMPICFNSLALLSAQQMDLSLSFDVLLK